MLKLYRQSNYFSFWKIINQSCDYCFLQLHVLIHCAWQSRPKHTEAWYKQIMLSEHSSAGSSSFSWGPERQLFGIQFCPFLQFFVPRHEQRIHGVSQKVGYLQNCHLQTSIWSSAIHHWRPELDRAAVEDHHLIIWPSRRQINPWMDLGAGPPASLVCIDSIT
jgi:hypothetical protein